MTLARVIVGDDGSDGAAAASAWAAKLGLAAGAEVTVVRVIEQQSGGRAGPVTGYRFATGATIERAGHPTAGLLGAAEETNADLIVVGRRGAGGFSELQLGSTAHQVVEHATAAVAVVPAAERPLEPTEVTWPFSRLAVGVDGSPATLSLLTWAAPLAAAASVPVWLVHALDLGPALAAAGIDDAGYDRVRSAAASTAVEWSRPLQVSGIDVRHVIEEGGAAMVLLDAVRSHEIDLLVVGRSRAQSGALLMGSVAHRAVALAPCPTIVVPG